jgi:hypothetical protein
VALAVPACSHPMKAFGIIFLAFALIAISVYLLFFKPTHRELTVPPRVPAAASPPMQGHPAAHLTGPGVVSATSAPVTMPVTNRPVSAPAPPAPVDPLPAELATLPPMTVLENMRTAIRNYGSTFGGNPVGTNQEITQQLAGGNPKQINFLKADGNRINSNGELVDVWGTPYFFHQLSGKEMEIRSAGADRVMWTPDDLVIR